MKKKEREIERENNSEMGEERERSEEIRCNGSVTGRPEGPGDYHDHDHYQKERFAGLGSIMIESKWTRGHQDRIHHLMMIRTLIIIYFFRI